MARTRHRRRRRTDAPRHRRCWLVVAALVGLGFAAASTWVHYNILRDPLYSSVCDVNATFSCTEAYTSRFGSVGGCAGRAHRRPLLRVRARADRPVPAVGDGAAEPGRLRVCGVDARPRRRALSRLRVVLRAQDDLPAVRRILRRDHRVVPHFRCSGQVSHEHAVRSRARAISERSFARPPRWSRAWRLSRQPVVAVMVFPGGTDFAPRRTRRASPRLHAADAAAGSPAADASSAARTVSWRASRACRSSSAAAARRRHRQVQRLSVPAVRQTYREYKPILAKLQQKYPGKIAFVTKDFPLDPECNSLGRRAPGGLRSGGGRPAGARKGQGRSDGGLAVRQSADDDAREVREGRRRRRRSDRLRRAISEDARTRARRHRAGPPARRERHADVLHERHPAARTCAASSSRLPSNGS